jgi:hypothetical protein
MGRKEGCSGDSIKMKAYLLIDKIREKSLLQPKTTSWFQVILILILSGSLFCLYYDLKMDLTDIKSELLCKLTPPSAKDTLSISSFREIYKLPIDKILTGCISPIENLPVPKNPNLLPNAPRDYRKGIHQGVDFFCHYNTPVRAIKDGWVLAIDKNYTEMPKNYRAHLLEVTKKLNSTPPPILYVLHGRKIVIDHGIINGHWIISVYSHLSWVDSNLQPGDYVKQGQIIGGVGCSGTNGAYKNSKSEAHLHFELRINGKFLGEGLPYKQVYELYRGLFNQCL